MTELIRTMLDQLRSKEYKKSRNEELGKPILIPTDPFGFNFCWEERKKALFEGNLAPNYRKVITSGFLAIRNEIEKRISSETDEKKLEFGKHMLSDLDECIKGCKYMRELAKEAGNDRLYDALLHVPFYPARSFFEACVSIKACMYFLRVQRVAHIGLGRFDQYMYPLYLKDLENGVKKEELFETIEAFFISLNYDTDLYPGVQLGDNGQSIVLGGRNIDGSTAYNELSEACMKASLELSLIDPKVNLRVDKNTPKEIFILGTHLTKQGLGFPQYSNDDIVIPALISQGYTPEDAHNYGVAACWEFIIPEKGGDIPNIGTMNFPLVISRAVSKHLTECDSFESFYEKVEKELADETDVIVKEQNAKPYRENALLSLLVDGCIDTLTDIRHGGAIYNNYGCHGAGIANAADALAAIKRLVFDEKSLSPQVLISALDADFSGYEELRVRLTSCPKMGNNDDYVDSLASKLMDSFTTTLATKRNPYGGIWRAGTGSAMFYILSAEKCPATADGRRAGEPFSSSFSPSLDIKTAGLLSVIQSFTKYDMKKICNGGPLTIEIHDTMLRNDVGIEKIATLVKIFVELGGHQLQLNSINRERLLDAQAHPKDHKNLIVRVWGWSGYFCELDLKYQNHIIRRTEYLS